jgi:hypothetical protein
MSDTSRRGFLAIAGAGVAGVAVASVAGSAGSAATGSSSPAADSAVPVAQELAGGTELPAAASGSLVAYVNDVRDGRLSVMVGEREVVIRDREIVARLANAAASANSTNSIEA